MSERGEDVGARAIEVALLANDGEGDEVLGALLEEWKEGLEVDGEAKDFDAVEGWEKENEEEGEGKR